MTLPLNNENESIAEEEKHGEVKQPLKNGTHEPGSDKTDDAAFLDKDKTAESFFIKRNKKRRFSNSFDNGKRNRINLTPLTSRGIRIEKFIKQKTGLSRTGLVLAILCIVLAIALLVCIILWPKSAHSKDYPVCTKPSCLRSSAEILSKLNVNESICNNFQNYACGNWFASNSLPKDRSEWNMKELLQFKYRQKLHELINTMPAPSEAESLASKAKIAYDLCMSVNDIRTDQELKDKILGDLGGWEVLHRFSLSSWNANKVMTTLYSEYRISPFFTVDVVPDVNDSNVNIIRLKPPVLGLPNRNYYFLSENDPVIVSYKSFIKDIVQQYGATVIDAISFGQSMFYYEKRIAEILDSNQSKAQTNYTRITIGELSQILVRIPLLDILDGKFPAANLNSGAYILVSSMSYFRSLANLLTYTNETGLNNYLMWRLVYEFLPYFPPIYVDTLNIHKRDITGEDEPIARWEFCISMLQKFAGYGLLALYENHVADKEKSSSVVSDLFSEISTVIKKNVKNLKRNELQSHLVDRIDSITVQIGLPSFMLQQKYVDSYYSSLKVIRYGFLQMVLYGLDFIQKDLQRRLTNPKEEYKWIDNMANYPTSVTFNPNADKVIIPSSILQQPFFEKEYALPALYGGIGVEIASAFVSGLILDKSYYENNKKLNANRNNRNDLATSLHYVSDCILHRNIDGINMTDKEVLVSTLTGIKYAYQGLKNELLDFNKHVHQPALETFENEELFYIISVQSLCTLKTIKKQNHEAMYSRSINNAFLANAVSTYSSDFSELFSCGEKSKYYESSLCMT